MAILKTSEQIRQALPVFQSQNWLSVAFETASSRESELRKASERIPLFPEIRASADVLFYIDQPENSEMIIVGLAADPSAPAGQRLFRGFINWSADHRLALANTNALDKYQDIVQHLEKQGYGQQISISGKQKKRWLTFALVVGVALAAAAAGFFLWRGFLR